MAPLFVLPFTLLVVLASFTSADQELHEIVTLCRPPPHQDWGRAGTAGNRLASDDKELGLQPEETIPGESSLYSPFAKKVRKPTAHRR